MTDLTDLKTPFGLLDRDTQEALMAHGGPWEYWTGHRWTFPDKIPGWFPELAYRVRPAPPKPREWWVDPERGIVTGIFHVGFIHVREVLPETNLNPKETP